MLKKLFRRLFKPKPVPRSIHGDQMNYNDEYFSTSAWVSGGISWGFWYQQDLYYGMDPFPWPELVQHHQGMEDIIIQKLRDIKRGIGMEDTIQTYHREFLELHGEVPDLVRDDDYLEMHRKIKSIT